jgi:hypothetical protein
MNDTNKYTSAIVNDMKVYMYTNELAILTGSYILKDQDTDGKEVEYHSRWTNAWLKRDGLWQFIAGHGNLVSNM